MSKPITELHVVIKFCSVRHTQFNVQLAFCTDLVAIFTTHAEINTGGAMMLWWWSQSGSCCSLPARLACSFAWFVDAVFQHRPRARRREWYRSSPRWSPPFSSIPTPPPPPTMTSACRSLSRIPAAWSVAFDYISEARLFNIQCRCIAVGEGVKLRCVLSSLGTGKPRYRGSLRCMQLMRIFANSKVHKHFTLIKLWQVKYLFAARVFAASSSTLICCTAMVASPSARISAVM